MLSQAPSVEQIDTNSVQVIFAAWSGPTDVFIIMEYRIEYMTDSVRWTIHSTREPAIGEESFSIVIDNLKVQYSPDRWRYTTYNLN